MTGFVAIHRSIWENEAFASEPMSEREAWMWMIAKAAWKDTQHRIGSKVVEVPRGTFFCSLKELQKTFRWKSIKRVRTFLGMLENGHMIGTQTGTGKTQVTICNYEKFQDVGHVGGTAGARKRHAGGTLKEQGNNKTNKSKTRASCVANDFWPVMNEGTKTRKEVDGWPPGRLETEVERFIAYHQARGNRYPDWQKAWTTWALSDFQRNQRPANDKPADNRDGVAKALDRRLGLDEPADPFGRPATGDGGGSNQNTLARIAAR